MRVTLLDGFMMRMLPLVRRRLPVVVATTLLMFAGTLVLDTWKTPEYRAHAVIRVVDPAPRAGAASAFDGNAIGPPIVSRAQLLRSQTLARAVVAAEGMRIQLDRQPAKGLLDRRVSAPGALWLRAVTVDSAAPPARVILDLSDRDFGVTGLGPTRRASYAVPVSGSGVRFTVGTGHPSGRVALRVVSTQEAVEVFLRGLHARLRRGTDLLDVTYTDADPVRAQRAVNRAILVFQAMDAASVRAATERQREYVERRITATETLLREAELSRNALRRRANAFDSRARLATELQTLNARKLEGRAVRNDRLELVALRRTLDQQRGSAERLSVLASSPAVANIRELKALYTPLAIQQSRRDSLFANDAGRSSQDPELLSLDTMIARGEQRIIATIDGQIAQRDARIVLLGTIDTLGRAVEELAGAAERETRLKGEVADYAGEVQRLRVLAQTLRVAGASEGGRVEIIDTATVPAEREHPPRRRALAIALLVGLALGSHLSWIGERFRGVINDRDDLDEALSARTLAVVPIVERSPDGGALVARTALASPGAEAFRTLRTNLRLSPVMGAVRRVAVTSAKPREGKSTVAGNLAIVLAHQGERVLLVDCDLRRPSLHTLFQLPRSPGLADVLTGACPLADAIRVTETEHLSVLTAGSASPTPTELLAGDAIQALLSTLSARYDMLVVDSPSLLGPADAMVVSGWTDGTLLVVRAGVAQRSAVHEALRQLASARSLLVGPVLNGCNERLPRLVHQPRLGMHDSRAPSTV